MSDKKHALVYFRKSSFHPEPVVCCVIPVPDGAWSMAKDRAERWKEQFLRKFPEFKNADFYTEETEIL
jgi:hypothetical protein